MLPQLAFDRAGVIFRDPERYPPHQLRRAAEGVRSAAAISGSDTMHGFSRFTGSWLLLRLMIVNTLYFT
jgi:hypothetical protein